jgi:hypothetical protein
MLTRRDLIRLSGASLLYAQSKMTGQPSGLTTEMQKGDPDASYEHVSFNGEAIKQLVFTSGKATFEKWDKDFPLKMISTARTFLGISRETTPGQITEFLALFQLPFKDSSGYVAFCAAGLSFCALMAYTNTLLTHYDTPQKLRYFRKYMPDLEHYYFYPSVSCVDMYHIAAGKRRWIEHKTQPNMVPKPGWVVLFDWASSGTPDHCGIIAHATNEKIATLEFNTSGSAGGSQRNGGTVSEKERDYKYVKGFIVTNASPA